jgi:hypothetical protein
LNLRPARTHRVGVDHDVVIPVGGGETGLADRYFPRNDRRVPLLVTPDAGMDPATRALIARLLAERGYQVLVLRSPANDSKAIVNWAHGQPWFPGIITESNVAILFAQL